MSVARSVPVVFDINVLVDAVSSPGGAFSAWPSPPPIRGNLAANAVGIINDAREFSLYLSEHILVNLRRVLVDAYEWEPAIADGYLDVILDIADASGGGIVAPQTPVSDCMDHEDNRILECALASGALMIVSNDSDLLSMSPWRGTSIVTAEEFATRTDAMRR